MKYITLIILSTMLLACGESLSNKAPDANTIEREIEKGNFKEASRMIGLYIANDTISPEEKYQMNFRLDKMKRIKRDFSQRDTSVINYIKKHYPQVTSQEITDWEKSNALENMYIDGENSILIRQAETFLG